MEKNRVTFQGNTTTKRFKKRWLLLPSGEPPLKQEKLRKTLAHRKLGVVVILEIRAMKTSGCQDYG